MANHKPHHYRQITSLQAFIALLIVGIALGIFMMFTTYKDALIETDKVHVFLGLATMGGVLLLSLMYLVNKPHPSHQAPAAKKKSASRR